MSLTAACQTFERLGHQLESKRTFVVVRASVFAGAVIQGLASDTGCDGGESEQCPSEGQGRVGLHDGRWYCDDQGLSVLKSPPASTKVVMHEVSAVLDGVGLGRAGAANLGYAMIYEASVAFTSSCW